MLLMNVKLTAIEKNVGYSDSGLGLNGPIAVILVCFIEQTRKGFILTSVSNSSSDQDLLELE